VLVSRTVSSKRNTPAKPRTTRTDANYGCLLPNCTVASFLLLVEFGSSRLRSRCTQLRRSCPTLTGKRYSPNLRELATPTVIRTKQREYLMQKLSHTLRPTHT